MANDAGTGGGDAGFDVLAGITVEQTSEDGAVASFVATEHHLNAHGSVHGGALATLADVAMGGAVAQPGATPATVEMKVTFLEAATTGEIRAQARVRRRGSRITIVEADITDGGGQDVAHAIATFTTIASS